MLLVLTCEHASHALPVYLQGVFQGQEGLLLSHRGWDPGALEVYEALTRLLGPAYAAAGSYTRLAIELNRSQGHPSLYSPFTRDLGIDIRRRLMEEVWIPFRKPVADFIGSILSSQASENVLHLSLHSFTPVLNGIERNADIGLLYDPSRQAEKALAKKWHQRLLRQAHPGLRVRLNYPYKGNADGHTTSLRRLFGPRYLGFEIEMKQDWLASHQPEQIAKLLAESLPWVE